MEPMEFIVQLSCSLANRSLMPSTMLSHVLAILGYMVFLASVNVFNVAIPAATDTGLPANVLAWYTVPTGASLSIISFLPAIAAIGRPFPSEIGRASCRERV